MFSLISRPDCRSCATSDRQDVEHGTFLWAAGYVPHGRESLANGLLEDVHSLINYVAAQKLQDALTLHGSGVVALRHLSQTPAVVGRRRPVASGAADVWCRILICNATTWAVTASTSAVGRAGASWQAQVGWRRVRRTWLRALGGLGLGSARN